MNKINQGIERQKEAIMEKIQKKHGSEGAPSGKDNSKRGSDINFMNKEQTTKGKKKKSKKNKEALKEAPKTQDINAWHISIIIND